MAEEGGRQVKSGDVIAEIETDKATMEVEAVDEGTLGKILVAGRHRGREGQHADRGDPGRRRGRVARRKDAKPAPVQKAAEGRRARQS